MVQEAGIKQPRLTSLKGSDLNNVTSFYEIFVFGSYVNVVVKIFVSQEMVAHAFNASAREAETH